MLFHPPLVCIASVTHSYSYSHTRGIHICCLHKLNVYVWCVRRIFTHVYTWRWRTDGCRQTQTKYTTKHGDAMCGAFCVSTLYIPMHASTDRRLKRPDWIVFELDFSVLTFAVCARTSQLNCLAPIVVKHTKHTHTYNIHILVIAAAAAFVKWKRQP